MSVPAVNLHFVGIRLFQHLYLGCVAQPSKPRRAGLERLFFLSWYFKNIFISETPATTHAGRFAFLMAPVNSSLLLFHTKVFTSAVQVSGRALFIINDRTI